MGRTRDVSKILTSNTSILSLASASSIYQTIATTGLVEITPPTISVTGGSGSVSSTGVVSFTSASAISLNNVFSSTYDNYKILFISEGASTDNSVNIRLRASGSDNSTSNYNSGSSTASYLNQTSWPFPVTTVRDKFYIVEVYFPKLAQRTYAKCDVGMFASPGAYATQNNFGAYFTGADVFDSLTFIVSTGTITSGKFYVYGYNK
jgi:hypothetical protein